MSRRLFVALRPPPAIRTALLALGGGIAGARWQNDNQLHLTLAFLGAVDRHEGRAALDALATVRQPPFSLRLDVPGTFAAARADRVGVLWLAVAERLPELPARRGDGPLFRLATGVRGALRVAGLEIDGRRFLPHITLARFSPPGAPRDALRRWLSGWPGLPLSFPVDDFYLMESRMGNGGSHYAPLASFPLRAG